MLIVGNNGEQLSIPYFGTCFLSLAYTKFRQALTRIGIASSIEKDLQKQFQKGYPYGESGVDYPYPNFDNHSE